MNKRTAALVLIEDLVVLHCHYQQSKANTYTFVSREAWIDTDLEPGTRLLAQNKTLDKIAVVELASYGDITDLEFDNEALVYKFVLGKVNPSLLVRLDTAESEIDKMLKVVKRGQVTRIRELARSFLSEGTTSLFHVPDPK